MFNISAELTYPQPEGAMLSLITGLMNAATLLVLAAPAASFFLWANPATAASGLLGALLLWATVPSRAPRFEFDVSAAAAEAASEAAGEAKDASGASFLGDDDAPHVSFSGRGSRATEDGYGDETMLSLNSNVR